MNKTIIITYLWVFLFCCVNVFGMVPQRTVFANNSEDKTIAEISLSDDFDEKSVIVIMDSNNSTLSIGQYITFFNDERIIAIDKLTNQYEFDNNSYEQVLCLKLNTNTKSQVIEFVREIEQVSGVKYVGPNRVIDASMTPNDTDYAWEQDNLQVIDIERAWEYTTGSDNVKIGIIDSGIASHPDLNANVVSGYDFYNNNSITNDDVTGHGTFVAGIVGAVGNNENGIAGVCWNVLLVPLQVANSNGKFSMNAVISAIDYATNSYNTSTPIKILNFSGGLRGRELPELEAAIRRYPGLFICSAGNKKDDGYGLDTDIDYQYPAFYGSALYDNPLNNLISVGNLNNYDGLPSDSLYGAKTISLYAPGTEIYSTYLANGYGEGSGTSFSAPQVAGVAGLLLSKYPTLTTSELKLSILLNVDVLSVLNNKCATSGRLNAYKALSNPHYHQYNVYTNLDADFHSKACACGCVDAI